MINKEKFKNIIITGLLFLIFLLTQFMYPLNLGGRTIYIYYVEIYIIILCLISFCDILFNKKKIEFNKITMVILIFLLWFVIASIYRYFVYHDITGGFIIFRVLFFPLLLILLLRQYSIDKKYILISLILFVFFINLYHIYDLIIINNSFRSAQTLKNLNIYLCFTISSIPIMLFYLREYKSEKLSFNVIKLIVFINIILITIFSILSGSRMGLLLCPFVVFFSYFLIYKISKKSILLFIGLVSIVFVSIASIIYFNLYDSRENVFRSVEPIIKIFADESKIAKKLEPIENIESNISENNNIIIDNKDSDSTIISNIDEQNSSVTDSNNMRLSLWEKSIYYICKSPIFGIGSTDIDIDMYFSNLTEPVKLIQSPHNFILEMCIAFGLPGMFIYLFIIVISIIKVFHQKIDIYNKFNFLLSLVSILGFSFFQPLVTSYFAISILMWINYYIYLKED